MMRINTSMMVVGYLLLALFCVLPECRGSGMGRGGSEPELSHVTVRRDRTWNFRSYSGNLVRRDGEVSQKERELQELGLVEEEGVSIFFAGGLVLIGLGILVIAISVWYYLRPEPSVPLEDDAEPADQDEG